MITSEIYKHFQSCTRSLSGTLDSCGLSCLLLEACTIAETPSLELLERQADVLQPGWIIIWVPAGYNIPRKGMWKQLWQLNTRLLLYTIFVYIADIYVHLWSLERIWILFRFLSILITLFHLFWRLYNYSYYYDFICHKHHLNERSVYRLPQPCFNLYLSK